MKSKLEELKDKLSADKAISAEKKEELLALLEELKAEMASVDSEEHVNNITGHVQRSTDEVTKDDKDPDLIEKAIGDLRDSVTEFEVSHPKLFEKVNNISAMLASMGI